MSTRFGMQDGRCFTVYTASGLLNDYIMQKNGIGLADNYAYRQFLQTRGPEVMRQILDHQKVQCGYCDKALIDVRKTY